MESYNPEYVLILSGDHIYKMDYEVVLDFHKANNADVTIATMPVPMEEASRFGIVIADENKKIMDFQEKPKEPKSEWAVPPFYYYVKEDLPLIKEGIENGCGTDAPGSFVSYLAERRPVHAFLMPGKRFDVGSIEGYEKIRKEYKGIEKR